jgi:hypothetical protein
MLKGNWLILLRSRQADADAVPWMAAGQHAASLCAPGRLSLEQGRRSLSTKSEIIRTLPSVSFCAATNTVLVIFSVPSCIAPAIDTESQYSLRVIQS